jgi:hypothetical protein
MEKVNTQVEVILGVDTHLDVHVGVVIDAVGRIKGTLSIATNPSGYEELLIWHKASAGWIGPALKGRVPTAPV